MSRSIDLNCDLGEGCGNDAELMPLISSANIACGFHAGDDDTMRRTVELAIENNVAIGAHPSFPDRENFGRTEMSLPLNEVFDIVTEQISKLSEIAAEFGAGLNHVKPHGALYNQSARDRELAATIARAVSAVDRALTMFGLSGSAAIEDAQAAGLKTASEVFADRTYQRDGTLTPRSKPNALITDQHAAVAQVLKMVEQNAVELSDGSEIGISCDTVCIHGDGVTAVPLAKGIHNALISRNITICAPK